MKQREIIITLDEQDFANWLETDDESVDIEASGAVYCRRIRLYLIGYCDTNGVAVEFSNGAIGQDKVYDSFDNEDDVRNGLDGIMGILANDMEGWIR